MELKPFSRTVFLAFSVLFTISTAQRYDGQYWPCNPMTNATGACTPNPGLATSTYSVDFTQQTALPVGWTISNYATVPFTSKGAEFTFAKRYDAPQLWTNFYILFGRVETVMQVAPGIGIISSSVLMSDNFDEIDWEFSGNNFNLSTTGMGQNNYFGKGITGDYDRGMFFNVASPMSQTHTYVVDWTPTQITWSVDGVIVRTLLATDCKDNNHQFPQTPSKFQLGIWDGGDAGANWGTVSWAGGYTDLTKAPFTMYVKSVKITNANPAYAYNYTDQSGKWQSIQLIKESIVSSSSSSKATVPSTIAPSASSSVVSQISSSLSSLGAQLAGTTGTPSVTAVIATKSVTSQVTSIGSIPVTTSVIKTTSTSTAKTTSSSTRTANTTSTSVTTSKATSTTTSTQKTTSTTTSAKPTYTPYWHYWRLNGHWVRGWW